MQDSAIVKSWFGYVSPLVKFILVFLLGSNHMSLLYNVHCCTVHVVRTSSRYISLGYPSYHFDLDPGLFVVLITFTVERGFLMFLLNALLQAAVGKTAWVDDLKAVDDMTAVDGVTAGVTVPPAVCCQHSE